MHRRQGVFAVLVLLTGCASVQAPRPAMVEAPRPPSPRRNDVVLFAMGLLDTRYSRGGRGPATGFDCSGLVSHVFQEATGLRVHGTSAELGQKARPVPADQIQPGDLVFFNTTGEKYSHAGIYVGQGRFVHAPSAGGTVRLDYITSPYWAAKFTEARRMVPQ